jgi:hypothetical protein
MKSNFRDVNAINYNLPCSWLYQTKKSTYEGSLPIASSANNTNLVPSFKSAIYPTKNERCIGPISDLFSDQLSQRVSMLTFCFYSFTIKAINNNYLQILYLHFTHSRPIRRRAAPFYYWRGFTGNMHVLI